MRKVIKITLFILSNIRPPLMPFTNIQATSGGIKTPPTSIFHQEHECKCKHTFVLKIALLRCIQGLSLPNYNDHIHFKLVSTAGYRLRSSEIENC